MIINKIFAPPYIVIGMHRSGTSLISELLSSSGVFMGNDLTSDKESWFFQRINIELLKQNGFNDTNPGVPLNSGGVVLNNIDLARHYIAIGKHPVQLLKLLSGKPWGWKDPRNTFTLDYWLKIFPKAKVIHIYRNGLDVAISLYNRNKNFSKDNKWYEPLLESQRACFNLWEKYLEQSFSCEKQLGDKMLNLQFEKIIACQESEVRKLEEFTRLIFKPAILKMADKERTNRYKENGYEDLVSYARQSLWMKKLGYIND